MRAAPWLLKAQHAACCLLAFTIPLPFIFSTYAIWLILLCWLFRGRFRDTWHRLKTNPPLFLWILYFLLHVISYTYSEDKGQSGFDIVSKASFAILPVLIGAGTPLDRKRLEGILAAFTAGVTAVALFCLVQALVLWSGDGRHHHFFYHDLVRGLDANAVYAAWYVLFSLAALLLFGWQRFFAGRMRALRWVLVALQLIFFFLLSARLLLVLFCLMVVPLLARQLWRTGRIRKTGFAVMGGGLALVLVLLVLVPNPIRQRFQDVVKNDVSEAFMNDYRGHDQRFTNLTLRLFVWRMGLENMSAHNLWLFGAGNGDVHYLLNHRMADYGIRDMDDATHTSHLYNVNMHNMYLQTLVMLGITGLVVFLLLVFWPFRYLAYSGHPDLFLVFFVISALFMCQEAALQTQAGIIYYTFISVIFWQLVRNRRVEGVENGTVNPV